MFILFYKHLFSKITSYKYKINLTKYMGVMGFIILLNTNFGIMSII